VGIRYTSVRNGNGADGTISAKNTFTEKLRPISIAAFISTTHDV